MLNSRWTKLALAFLGFLLAVDIVSAAQGVRGVAWWAHIGGFLFGVIAANIFAPRPRRVVRTW